MTMTRESIQWQSAGQYEDIKYDKAEGIAKITINRPQVRNAFRPQTVHEMSHALNEARDDESIGVIILTGEGDKAFCSGGDQKIRGDAGYKDSDGTNRLNVLDFQRQMRTCPKPIVAMVAGYAIGGGHILHLLCDLTIAAENARFGQTGPRVGSFDGGYGASYMARIVGQKRHVKSGFFAGNTMRSRRWRWAWSIRLFRWISSKRRPCNGVARSSAIRRWPYVV